MTSSIHPSACVAPGARLGPRVTVSAGAVIEDDVEIGADCVIGAHAVIHRRVSMGERNQVYPHAVLGGQPQDLGFDPLTETRVAIGDDNIFREGATVNRATRAVAATRIGSGCFFMNNSHVAHDCVVGDRVIMATGVALGGHVTVEDGVFLGGGAMVHQFCRVGRLAMVMGLCAVVKDVIPFTMVAGARVRHFRLNTVGLRRAGIDREGLRVLSEAYRRLRRRASLEDLPMTPEVAHLKDWLAANTRRGIHGFAQPRGKNQGERDD
ncbi:MAG: acyl-ACP--UDP-N-acetylglucosamine O-acyltransferase [Gammaproteobacteria bacterium]